MNEAAKPVVVAVVVRGKVVVKAVEIDLDGVVRAPEGALAIFVGFADVGVSDVELGLYFFYAALGRHVDDPHHAANTLLPQVGQLLEGPPQKLHKILKSIITIC